MSRKISGSYILQPAPTKYIDVTNSNAISVPSPSRTLDSHGAPQSPDPTRADTHFSYLTHADDEATHASAYRAARRREIDEKAALGRSEKVARMEEAMAWTLYRKMDGGMKMQHRVHNRKEIEKWFQATTRDHPDGNDRVKPADLVDTLISLGFAQSKKQVQKVFVKLKSRADPDGLLDGNAFCDALEKDFKIQPKTNFGLEDGEEGNNKGADLLQIPTRLALHRRHVIMSALRSHSILDEDIGDNDVASDSKAAAKDYTDVVPAKNSAEARRRRTARALQQAPSWLLQQDLHEANLAGLLDGSDDGDSSAAAEENSGHSHRMWYDEIEEEEEEEDEEEKLRALLAEKRAKSMAFLANQGQGLLQRDKEKQSQLLRMAPQSKDYDVMGRRWKDIQKSLKPPIAPPQGAVLDKGWTPYPKRTGPRPGPALKFPKYGGAAIRKDFPKKPEELQLYQKKAMRRMRLARQKQDAIDLKKMAQERRKAKEPRFQISVHQFNKAIPTIRGFDLDSKMKEDARALTRQLLANDARDWSLSPTKPISLQ